MEGYIITDEQDSRDVFMFKLPLPFLLFSDDSDGTPKLEEVDQPGETTHIVKVSNEDLFLKKNQDGQSAPSMPIREEPDGFLKRLAQGRSHIHTPK